jgi:hypothetical protein
MTQLKVVLSDALSYRGSGWPGLRHLPIDRIATVEDAADRRQRDILYLTRGAERERTIGRFDPRRWIRARGVKRWDRNRVSLYARRVRPDDRRLR